ncbi:MAG: hypothetical protein KDB14_24025 [Planctomycetales bacterium]|nr:hypothetical protein [Planctomycetales bacterium]
MTASLLESKDNDEPQGATGGFWPRLDKWLLSGSEWLNPILVKEARQSLKSRQFVLTFGLLLLTTWAWTAMAVTMMQSNGVGAGAAQEVFGGYFLVLEVPLLVIVPFAAFRSLAGEREDGTYELVSITTLAARQIVLGKLASGMLQIMVYFSVMAPCIAFTYMLRGMDLISIGMTLYFTLLFSITLTCTGLLMASSVRSIHWQVLTSLVMLGITTLTAIGWASFVFEEIVRNGIPVDQPQFWEMTGFLTCMAITLNALQLAGGVADLSFPSDNRSTKIRLTLLANQVAFTGWMMYLWVRYHDRHLPIMMSLLATGFWMFAGTMLTAEHPVLSPRVRRSLPRSFLGRMAFTWFNPGSGSGYVFAVTNALGVFGCVLACWWMEHGRRIRPHEVHAAGLAVSYVAIYLGIGRMALQFLRRYAQFGVVVGLMIHALIAVLGILLPVLARTVLFWNERFEYSYLQLPNWGMTLIMALDRPSEVFHEPFYAITIHGTAAVIFLVTLISGAKEVRQLRQATPERVLADERLQSGQTDEKPQKPKNPFDD